ncbi:hypothetical protein NMY22_g16821 [Coprinellus aureogranulatus]|nr:hypothetical protein NMY22_g16821 [Coprinellus aureogranulatus]
MARRVKRSQKLKRKAPPLSRPPSPAFERIPLKCEVHGQNGLQATFPPCKCNNDSHLLTMLAQDEGIIHVIKTIGEILDEEIFDARRELDQIREDFGITQYTSSSPTTSAPRTPEFKPMELVELSTLLEGIDVQEGTKTGLSTDVDSAPRRSLRLAESATRLTESNLRRFNEANNRRHR